MKEKAVQFIADTNLHIALNEAAKEAGINRSSYIRNHFLELFGIDSDNVRIKRPGRFCSLEYCDRPHSAKGLCANHYSMQRDGYELKPSYKQSRSQTEGDRNCRGCDTEKDISAFYRRSDGLVTSQCKECIRRQVEKYQKGKKKK